MQSRATQDRQVMVENSDKMCSTGDWNGKPLQYSCLENPKNSMKRQKDMTLKDELPRSVGARYATGEVWRNDSRKIEGRRRRGQRRMSGCMASLTWWTWIWVNSRRWWWTGRPGMLQSMGLQRVGHDWATELIYLPIYCLSLKFSVLCLSISLLSIDLSSMYLSIYCLVAKMCPTLLRHHEL